uniref:CBM21 domain-containing protein n=1 Tax=Macrostomum lignano TaxID=282301 RepID=A0A1I8ILF3_9PLAT
HFIPQPNSTQFGYGSDGKSRVDLSKSLVSKSSNMQQTELPQPPPPPHPPPQRVCKPLACVLNHPVKIYARGENPISPNGQRAAETIDASIQALRSLPRNCSKNSTVRQLLCQSAIKGSRRRQELMQSLTRPSAGSHANASRRKSLPAPAAYQHEATASSKASTTQQSGQRSVSLRLVGGGGRERVLAALSENASMSASAGGTKSPSKSPLFYCDDESLDEDGTHAESAELIEDAKPQVETAGWANDYDNPSDELTGTDPDSSSLTQLTDLSRNFVLLHSRLDFVESESKPKPAAYHHDVTKSAAAAAADLSVDGRQLCSNPSMDSSGSSSTVTGDSGGDKDPTDNSTLMMRKAVRFIDSFGLDLTYTKLLVDVDKPPAVPPEALLYLDLSGGQDDETGATGCRTNGIVRVANLGYEKCVIVRVSFNNWRTFADIYAAYVIDSSDGLTDRFSFSFVLPRNFSVGDRVEFCFRYDCYGSVYWDSNAGRNYTLVYFAANPDVAD